MSDLWGRKEGSGSSWSVALFYCQKQTEERYNGKIKEEAESTTTLLTQKYPANDRQSGESISGIRCGEKSNAAWGGWNRKDIYFSIPIFRGNSSKE